MVVQDEVVEAVAELLPLRGELLGEPLSRLVSLFLLGEIKPGSRDLVGKGRSNRGLHRNSST